MDAVAFGIPVIFMAIFLFIGLFERRLMVAVLPFLGGVFGATTCTTLATDGVLVVGYQSNGTPITQPVYPIILIPATLLLFSFIVTIYRGLGTRRGEFDRTPEKFVLILLLVFMVGLGAVILPGAVTTLLAADLGTAGLNLLVSSLVGILSTGAVLSFAAGSWKAAH